jgi:hypothetical protein
MFAKFVRCFLTVVFFVLFSVVCHIGSDADVVSIHINVIGAMVSSVARAETINLTLTGFSPRFDMEQGRGSGRFVLRGREEVEVEVAVSIEIRSRGPPERRSMERVRIR